MQRSMAFWTVLLLGLALLIVGMLLVAPPGYESVDDADPEMTGAPILVVVGIVIMFSSAVVYELFPGHEEDDDEV